MFYSPDYEVPMHSDNTIDNTLFAWSQKQSGNHQYMDRGNLNVGGISNSPIPLK